MEAPRELNLCTDNLAHDDGPMWVVAPGTEGSTLYIRSDLVPHWRPIKKAPEAEPILAIWEGGGSDVSELLDGEWYHAHASKRIPHAEPPTHWMPLIAPPAEPLRDRGSRVSKVLPVPVRTVLEQLLSDDGVSLPRGGGAEKAIPCFHPDHLDRTPSMSVNVAKGVYNCHGSGASGNAYDYLTQIRRLEPAEAMRALEGAGATDTFAKATRKQSDANEEQPPAPAALHENAV